MEKEDRDLTQRSIIGKHNDLSTMLQSSKLNLKELWLKPEIREMTRPLARDRDIAIDSIKGSPLMERRKLSPVHINAIFSKAGSKRPLGRDPSRNLTSHSSLHREKRIQGNLIKNPATVDDFDKSHNHISHIPFLRSAGMHRPYDGRHGDSNQDTSRYSSLRDDEKSSGSLGRYIDGKRAPSVIRNGVNLSDLLRSKKMDSSLLTGKITKISHGSVNCQLNGGKTDDMSDTSQHQCRSGMHAQNSISCISESEKYDSLKKQIGQFEKYLETVTNDLIKITQQRDGFKKENTTFKVMIIEKDQEITELKSEIEHFRTREDFQKSKLDNLTAFVDKLDRILNHSELGVTSQSGSQPPLIAAKSAKPINISFQNLAVRDDKLNEKLQSILSAIESMMPPDKTCTYGLYPPDFSFKKLQIVTPKFRQLHLDPTLLMPFTSSESVRPRNDHAFGNLSRG